MAIRRRFCQRQAGRETTRGGWQESKGGPIAPPKLRVVFAGPHGPPRPSQVSETGNKDNARLNPVTYGKNRPFVNDDVSMRRFRIFFCSPLDAADAPQLRRSLLSSRKARSA